MLGVLGSAEERVSAAELNALGILLFFSAPLVAFRFGLHWGRRKSAIAFGVCLVLVVTMGFLAHAILEASQLHAWQMPDGHPYEVVTAVGMAALSSALALAGPIAFEKWWAALLLSGAIVLAFVLPVIPLIYAGCLLFGLCI